MWFFEDDHSACTKDFSYEETFITFPSISPPIFEQFQ